MFKKTLMMTVLSGVLLSATGLAIAADQDRARLHDHDQMQDRD